MYFLNKSSERQSLRNPVYQPPGKRVLHFTLRPTNWACKRRNASLCDNERLRCCLKDITKSEFAFFQRVFRGNGPAGSCPQCVALNGNPGVERTMVSTCCHQISDARAEIVRTVFTAQSCHIVNAALATALG